MRGPLEWIRFRSLKFLYDTFFIVMVRDASWQEPLLAAVAAEANSRILNFGPGSAATARNLAIRFPKATIVGVDPNPRAVKKARRIVARSNIANLTIIDAPRRGRLPFDAGSFDKVVLVLTLHDRMPDEKLEIAKKMLRLLRHGGKLHVADYDKPAVRGERGILSFVEYISGPAAAEPHITGNWTDFLAKAGFVGIRRQSSHSVGIGRISVVKARKQ